ncbi:MAG: hypothetical protein ABEI32_16370 [Halothece sp.]
MMIKLNWNLRDYVFGAFMAIGMIASIFIIAPLVPPFLEVIAWAPAGGIFLTLGMARLEKRGSVFLIVLPLAVLVIPLSPAIALYLVLTILVTEIVVSVSGNYRSKRNRLLGTVLFFSSAVVIGLVGSGLILGDEFTELFTKPWLIGVFSLTAGVTGGIGWWLGEKIVSQLKHAGKLDHDL